MGIALVEWKNNYVEPEVMGDFLAMRFWMYVCALVCLLYNNMIINILTCENKLASM